MNACGLKNKVIWKKHLLMVQDYVVLALPQAD
jgi:hypothetical protein